MNPGQLDRLITVQSLAETRDSGGGVGAKIVGLFTTGK